MRRNAQAWETETLPTKGLRVSRPTSTNPYLTHTIQHVRIDARAYHARQTYPTASRQDHAHVPTPHAPRPTPTPHHHHTTLRNTHPCRAPRPPSRPGPSPPPAPPPCRRPSAPPGWRCRRRPAGRRCAQQPGGPARSRCGPCRGDPAAPPSARDEGEVSIRDIDVKSYSG